jgi:CubicO group peptidase (beta-lactamase class C family)
VVAVRPRPQGAELERADSRIDDQALSAGIDAILNRWPAVGLAVGVVRDGRLSFFRGHGVADIASGALITEDTVFRVASISKTFTAIAVMQLWEHGLVDLDAPANDYLRTYKLVPAKSGFPPATVRHLLTHTAGIAEVVPTRGAFRPDFGESVPVGRPLPSLASYYHGSLRVHAEPGTRFVYGNHGIATLGQLIEDVSGEPLGRYLRDHVFEPLGMTGTDLVRSERIESRLATGYEMARGGPKAVEPRELVTAGAASVYSSPRDMARYLAALVGGGANEHGSVLRPATLASMFEPHYRPDPRVPGMGLGFFRVSLGGRSVVEHQGTLPGFHSQIFVAPAEGIGVMAFTNGSWLPDFWLPVEISGLLRQLIGVPDEAIRTDIAQRPDVWGDICGWYSLSARLADVRLRGMMGAGAEVFVRAGRPTMRFLTPVPTMYRGFTLHPDSATDPCAFRIDMSAFGTGSMRVLFGRERATGTMSLYLELMPLMLRRQPAATNPRLLATAGLGALGVALATVTVRRSRATARGS